MRFRTLDSELGIGSGSMTSLAYDVGSPQKGGALSAAHFVGCRVSWFRVGILFWEEVREIPADSYASVCKGITRRV